MFNVRMTYRKKADSVLVCASDLLRRHGQCEGATPVVQYDSSKVFYLTEDGAMFVILASGDDVSEFIARRADSVSKAINASAHAALSKPVNYNVTTMIEMDGMSEFVDNIRIDGVVNTYAFRRVVGDGSNKAPIVYAVAEVHDE